MVTTMPMQILLPNSVTLTYTWQRGTSVFYAILELRQVVAL